MSNKWKYNSVPSIKPLSNELDLSNIVSMGSCFSRNIVRWLNHYEISNSEQIGDILYNPYSIYYEIKRLLEPLDAEKFAIKYKKSTGHYYTDPWRSWIESDSLSKLKEKNDELDVYIINKLKQSTGIIITYGLSEVWSYKDDNNLVLNNLKFKDEFISSKEIENRFLSLNETIKTMEKTVEYIYDINVNLPIIFTLSPIPLKYTSSDYDIRTANNISKSTLRIALFEICKEYSNVHYFPSYEIIQSIAENSKLNIWQLDGRHLNASVINIVGEYFLKFSKSSLNKLNTTKFYIPKVDQNGKVIGKCYE